jgi:hypothetical protein
VVLPDPADRPRELTAAPVALALVLADLVALRPEAPVVLMARVVDLVVPVVADVRPALQPRRLRPRRWAWYARGLNKALSKQLAIISTAGDQLVASGF